MKKKKNLKVLWFTIIMGIITNFAFFSCNNDGEKDAESSNTTDVAVTSNVSKIGITYAQIEGYVNLNLITSNYTNPQIGIEISQFEDFSNARHVTSNIIEGNKISIFIDKLSGASDYYYRTLVMVNKLCYYGEKRSFTTKDFSNITSTGDASNLTYTSAKINCKVDEGSIDGENSLDIGIAYSAKKYQIHPDSLNYDNTRKCPIDNIKNNSYEISLSYLQPGMTYYYCSYTRAGSKYKLGEIKSFTSRKMTSTEFSTDNASEITTTSATLKGSSSVLNLYPAGTSFSYGFLYSKTKEALNNSNLGNISYNKVNATINGNIFTARLDGLTMGTIYYYCAYINIDGIDLTGEIKNFTTQNIWGSMHAVGYDYFSGGAEEEWDATFEMDATDPNKIWIYNICSNGCSASSPVYGIVTEDKTEIHIPVGQTTANNSSYDVILEGFRDGGETYIQKGGYILGRINPNGTITIRDWFGTQAFNAGTTTSAGWYAIEMGGVFKKQ